MKAQMIALNAGKGVEWWRVTLGDPGMDSEGTQLYGTADWDTCTITVREGSSALEVADSIIHETLHVTCANTLNEETITRMATGAAGALSALGYIKK